MALFEVTTYDKKIYEEELRDFLPEKILDVHTHVWLDRFKQRAPEKKRTVSWPDLVALDNSFEDLQETYRLMFPGKDVKALIFSTTAMFTSARFPKKAAGLPCTSAIPTRVPRNWKKKFARAAFWALSPTLTYPPSICLWLRFVFLTSSPSIS